MKKKFQIITVIIILTTNIINAQSLMNGDLEGTITGAGTLPPFWQAVSHTDINCQADPGGTTPDLTSTTQPSISAGMVGNPYSGSAFVAGSHGIGASSGTIFQEGILQDVTGFSIGTRYAISFYQSVVKTSQSLDTSGSWMVIVDDSIIGITTPTNSQEPFNSTSFLWEQRSISFYASKISHTIKFLPLDDDNDLLSSPTNINGALHMGIDSINIKQVIATGIAESKELCDINVFPNPTRGILIINLGSEAIHGDLIIYNTSGVKLYMGKISPYQTLNLSEYPMGIYHLQIFTDFGIINKAVLKN